MRTTEDTTLHKSDFDSIYDQPDPRAYFRTLARLDYTTPQHGADVFSRLLREHPSTSGRPSTVLDLCCSYGVVSTLLKTDLDLAEVYRHYGAPATRSMTNRELAAADVRLLRERRRAGAPLVAGLDVAKNAVDYAVTTGTLDVGFAENLEESDPGPRLSELLGDVDLITATGAIAYVTERTFERLVAAARPSVWVASFCLRTSDYGPIADALAARGLRTERLAGTYPQRRFTDADEQRWAVEEVRARGLDPSGRESDGYYHAELYVSRPARQVADRPLEQLLPVRS